MKKSELSQLTQIIEHLVRKEIRKQLPVMLSEAFLNMAGKRVVAEEKQKEKETLREEVEQASVEPEENSLKASLREIFAGATPVKRQPVAAAPQHRQVKQYTKDPKLNAILNETVSDLRAREGMVGLAAFQGGYSPGGMVAATGPGQMMEGPEPEFLRNIPTMQGGAPSIPIGRPPVLAEGQESSHAPLEALPEGLSALDVAKQVQLPGKVNEALTRNYSAMMKLIDNKRKGKA